ncbi:hypothetical protein NMS_2519 [Nonlabens marinus S1-08]|uniref:Uncharacterized protein n=1 Tax=Nonlabens marinus S1-08 TaxID=1454201 RepID=W8VWQ1_9FLAO|nr:hypothetical protein NMS_2519 [Nonlabens marinus S1-08]
MVRGLMSSLSRKRTYPYNLLVINRLSTNIKFSMPIIA